MVSSNVFKGTAMVASTLVFMMIGFYVQDEVMKATEVGTSLYSQTDQPRLDGCCFACCSVE